MHIQDFLRNGGTIAQLEENWAINVKRHGTYPHLVLLKYDQIESPMAAPIVQEARGLILDESDDWRVIARPFDKFFSYGEVLAPELDWSTAKVQEKIDGSLCTLYFYDEQWRVATSGSPDAAGDVNDLGFTFHELFFKIWRAHEFRFPDSTIYREFSFMFELTSPYNRVVVPHAEPRLTLIGVRDTWSGKEQEVSKWADMYPVVQEFKLQSIQEITDSFAKLEPLKQEGYVVVDSKFNRIKVKHPGYVALHHLKDSIGASKRNVLDIIRKGETTEFCTHFPEYKEQFDEIRTKYHNLAGDLQVEYQKIHTIPDQKAFALEAVKTKIPAVLFELRKGRVKSVGHYLAEMNIDHLMKTLELNKTK